MASNAEEYAESLSSQFQSWADAGAPFGWINDTDEWTGDEPDGWRTDDTYDIREDGYREADALDYLSDVLDIQYLVTSDARYRAARICIAFGGPTAWIDTRTGLLEVQWWSAPVTRSLPEKVIDGLDAALEELWETR